MLVIGAITALFMGFLGIIQNDIKRVVAYSTLSQLGYMTVALGASAYSVAVFHLMTHAFFKALLFLGAGSVIIGMHHEQDMRNMGGLRKYMPITWITSLIGSLALIGTPFFAGFYSKDSIIEAVHASHLPGAGFAYFAVLAGVFVTAFYSFRMYFLVFHGKERFATSRSRRGARRRTRTTSRRPRRDAHATMPSPMRTPPTAHAHAPHESPWVVTLPLMLLAIPSVVIGCLTIEPDAVRRLLQGRDRRRRGERIRRWRSSAEEFHGPVAMALHALHGAAVLARARRRGAVAGSSTCVSPDMPAAIQRALRVRSTRCSTTSTTSTGSTRTSSRARRAPARHAACGRAATSA